MKRFYFWLTVLLATFISCVAFAAITTEDMSFFEKFLEYVKTVKDLPLVLQISGAIVLIISTMKVSFIKPLWDKLGEKQEWLAPALGLISGALMGFADGKFDWTVLFTYLFAGAGAPYLHDILDKIKAIPGLGQIWLTVIEVIKKLLFAPKETPQV